ncbi:SDR family oxidoreductase [Agromyces lapidis]
MIRDPAHSDEVAETGAHPVVADIETLDVDGFVELVRGHDAVVWSAGAGGGDPRRTYAVDRDAALRSMAAAELAGVRRYVMVSYFRSPDHTVPEADAFRAYAEAKAAADEHLMTMPLDWTILGPSRLTDGEGTGRIDTEASESLTVDRADAAAVAAAVLEEPVTIGRTIRFNAGATPIADAIR